MFVFIIIVSCFIYGCELCGKEPAIVTTMAMQSTIGGIFSVMIFWISFSSRCLYHHTFNFTFSNNQFIHVWRFWSWTNNNRCVWNTILVWYLAWSLCLHLLHWIYKYLLISTNRWKTPLPPTHRKNVNRASLPGHQNERFVVVCIVAESECRSGQLIQYLDWIFESCNFSAALFETWYYSV